MKIEIILEYIRHRMRLCLRRTQAFEVRIPPPPCICRCLPSSLLTRCCWNTLGFSLHTYKVPKRRSVKYHSSYSCLPSSPLHCLQNCINILFHPNHFHSTITQCFVCVSTILSLHLLLNLSKPLSFHHQCSV